MEMGEGLGVICWSILYGGGGCMRLDWGGCAVWRVSTPPEIRAVDPTIVDVVDVVFSFLLDCMYTQKGPTALFCMAD